MYSTYLSDERRRDRENPPRPFGFHPSAQSSRAGGPGLWIKSGHTSLSPSTLEPPKSSGSASYGPIFFHNAVRPISVSRP